MDHDVAARLADGRAALDDAQTYASAARPHTYDDLEAWYGSERGLELQRLDADRAALEAAARSAADALESARAQLAALTRAWDGPGARSVSDFLRRHCDSAATVVDALTSATQDCADLRDGLWAAVDARVTATTTIADRVGAHRATWLPASQSVLSGAPEEAAAAVVADQVAPFVDTAIGDDWLRAMRTATDSARQAYRRAIERFDAWPGARFEVPGDLGPAPAVQAPAPTPVATAPQAAPAPPVAAAPSVAAAPPVAEMPSPAPVPPVTEAAPPPMAAPPGPAAPMPAASPPGAGMPNLGEALGGLFDGVAGPAPGESSGTVPDLAPPDLEPPALDESEELEEDPEGLDEAEEETDQEPEEKPEEDADVEPDSGPVDPGQLEPAESDAPAAELAQDEPEPITPPPPEPDCPLPAPPPPAATPCEMAADELPQVGE